MDSLVERGFVIRETLDGDRRAVRLSITRTGRGALDSTAVQLRSVLDSVLAHCSDPPVVIAALDQLRLALDRRWTEREAIAASTAGR